MPFNLSITTQAARGDGDGTSTSTMKLHLVANGEIYNHVQLYNQLILDGWDSNNRISNSDCEVIAHLFAYYGGNKTVQLLDGMFAFVIFAEEEQHSSSSSSSTASGSGNGVQVFAARDPVGIKPLYYGRTTSSSNDDDGNGGAAVFASKLKALVGHVESSTIVALPPGHYWSNSTTSSNNSNSTKMKTMKRK
jgi:asparagine synthase (glutamine-hydrolysing)